MSKSTEWSGDKVFNYPNWVELRFKLLKRNWEIFQRRIKVNKTYVLSRIFHSDFKLLRQSCHDLRLKSSLSLTSTNFQKFILRNSVGIMTWFMSHYEDRYEVDIANFPIESHLSWWFQIRKAKLSQSQVNYSNLTNFQKLILPNFCFITSHNKLFQRFIERAAIASLRCRDMQMLIWCFGSDVLRQKTLVFRNNAEERKLTALDDYGKNVHKISQAAQGLAVRWSFCEITVMLEL